MTAVTVVGVLVTIAVAIVAAALLFWAVVAVLIRRGRHRRAERLEARPDAYPQTSPGQDWHGGEP